MHPEIELRRHCGVGAGVAGREKDLIIGILVIAARVWIGGFPTGLLSGSSMYLAKPPRQRIFLLCSALLDNAIDFRCQSRVNLRN